MARTVATNFSGALQYPYATSATDVFKKEDIQTLALAVDQHDHTAGKGLSVAPTAGSVTNAMLGPDVARANLLTNGGFEIWQRGGGPFNGGGLYGPDRWVNYVPGGTTSTSKDVSNTDVAAGVGSCAAITTTAPANFGNGIYQVIDANADMLTMRGRQVTVSVRVKCSQANSVRVGLEGDKAVAGPSVFSSYHPGGGVYATLTATITLGVVNGLTVWITGTAAGTWYVDNACLVVGSQAANYVPLHPADDLARCLRYYEVLVEGTGVQSFFLSGYGTAAVGVRSNWVFRVPKPVTPTVTKVGTWTTANCGQPTIAGSDKNSTLLSTSCTGTGDTYAYPSAAGMNVTAEANP